MREFPRGLNTGSGGSVWESNPPETLLTPHTGFEDQASHQAQSAPVSTSVLLRTAHVGSIRDGEGPVKYARRDGIAQSRLRSHPLPIHV